MEMLLLTTPSQHMADNPAVELHPKRLKVILDDAPVEDVQKTVAFLESRITPFNEINIESNERLKLLEIFHAAYNEILISYDDLRLSTLPISPKERKAISLDIMWLYLNLAMGYKILVKEHADHQPGCLKDKSVVLVIYRAMELIINALLHTFRAHESPPPLAYLEMHQLYTYAAQLNINEIRVRQVSSYHGHPRIVDLYKQFLLLVMIDPYRQISNTIFEIFLLFEEHAHHAVLNPDLENEQLSNTCYQTSNIEDTPPVKCNGIIQSNPELLHIDISGVIESLKKSTQQPNATSFTQSSEIRLAEIILAQLEQSQPRSEEHIPCNQKVKTWFGMGATRFFLQSVSHLKNALQVEVHQGIAVSNLDVEEGEVYILSDFTMANHSNRGFYLTGDQQENDDLAGDIIGLVGANQTINLNQADSLLPEMALIRWERGSDNNELQIGVERIDGVPHLMEITSNENDKPHLGLFFTPAEHPARILHVLIPSELYKIKQKLNMVINTKTIPITLGARAFASSRYTVCRLSTDQT